MRSLRAFFLLLLTVTCHSSFGMRLPDFEVSHPFLDMLVGGFFGGGFTSWLTKPDESRFTENEKKAALKTKGCVVLGGMYWPKTRIFFTIIGAAGGTFSGLLFSPVIEGVARDFYSWIQSWLPKEGEKKEESKNVTKVEKKRKAIKRFDLKVPKKLEEQNLKVDVVDDVVPKYPPEGIAIDLFNNTPGGIVEASAPFITGLSNNDLNLLKGNTP